MAVSIQSTTNCIFYSSVLSLPNPPLQSNVQRLTLDGRRVPHDHIPHRNSTPDNTEDSRLNHHTDPWGPNRKRGCPHSNPHYTGLLQIGLLFGYNRKPAHHVPQTQLEEHIRE